MTSQTIDAHTIDDTLARRNAFVLAAAQSFAGAIPTVVIAMGGLAGYYLLGTDKSLATLPVSTYVLGTAAAIYPSAYLMKLIGRKRGFLVGGLLGTVSGLVSWFAIMQGLFWLLIFGTFLSGAAQAFTAQYRFAAADTASEAFRPKAISWVLVGGIAAGILGPQTSIWLKDLFDPILFAGAFIGQALLGAASMIVLLFLQVPERDSQDTQTGGRALLTIMSQFRFILAVGCAAISYALMSFVMTATPLAMIACNHSQENATLAIQWHVLGMFVPSFFTGNLIQRFGREAIVTAGLLMLAGCSVVALMGIEVAHFWTALILLGVGWNFAFIGATTMLTDCYRPEERAKTQATNDFIVFGTVAIASFSSGGILNAYGWEMLNYIMFPAVGLCLALLAIQQFKGKSA